MSIFMSTTKIPAEKTALEISTLLSKSGLVQFIQTEYEEGDIVGIYFLVRFGESKIGYKLPARWQPVIEAMEKDKHTQRHLCNPEQARRVAWRQVLRWVQAQLALIEIGMVDIKEVFMPYMMINKDITFYQKLEQGKFKLLELEDK